MSVRRRSSGGGPAEPAGPPGFTDDWSIAIRADDEVPGQVEDASFAITWDAGDDQVAGQSETVTLGFPAGNFEETSTSPTDGQAFVVRLWLGGTVDGDGAPANASNADGEPDGAVCTLQTNALGSNEESILTDLGAIAPSGTITSLIYRGWFTSSNELVTSKGELWARSKTGAFSDVLMFRNQDLNGTVDHSSGSFSFDLFAAGVDTAAKLADLEIEHYVNDLAAGVTPHTMTVDAGAVDIVGAL